MSDNKEFESLNLLKYFLIAFVWSWSFWSIPMMASNGLFELNPIIDHVLHVLGGFGPFVGAFTLTYINERIEGIKTLWSRFWNFKISKKWMFIIFLLFPAVLCSSFLISIIIEQSIPEIRYLNQPWMFVIYFIEIFFFLGPFNEEFGWRGYVIDRFQTKWNAVVSSLILGIIWSIWHLPLFFTVGTTQYGQNIILFIMMVLLLAIWFTWIFNNTNKNILAVVCLHAVINFSPNLFPIQNTTSGFVFYGIILLVVTLIIIQRYGSTELKKE